MEGPLAWTLQEMCFCHDKKWILLFGVVGSLVRAKLPPSISSFARSLNPLRTVKRRGMGCFYRDEDLEWTLVQ